MNIYKKYQEQIYKQLINLQSNEEINFKQIDFKLDDFSLDEIKTKNLNIEGDISCNIALVLAKKLKQNPIQLATKISSIIANIEGFEKVYAVKPGFINISLSLGVWQGLLEEVLKVKERFGCSDLYEDYAINVEFVSANPTGPLHLANIRGAVIGDTIANLLKFVSAKVTKEYYVNDGGSQVKNLVSSLEYRYKELFLKQKHDFPKDGYPSKYIIDLALLLKEKYSDRLLNKPYKEALLIYRSFAIDNIMQTIKTDLSNLGIEFDIFSFESDLVKEGMLDKLISDFTNKELLYKGRLPKPKKMSDDEEWNQDEKLLFRSTSYGDDIDRSFTKNDQQYTYFAHDCAYHKNKIDRLEKKKKMLIDVLGADHSGYIKRLSAAVMAISPKVNFLAVVCQVVRLISSSQVVRMSKRSGNFITIADVLKEMDKDTIRFFILSRRADAPLDIDFLEMVRESKDNVVFYVQYSLARIESLKALYSKTFKQEANYSQANLTQLNSKEEIAIIKKIAYFPKLIEAVAKNLELQKLTNYLNDLAQLFHSLWAMSRIDPKFRIIVKDNQSLSLARLALANAIMQVLTNCLAIFKVEPVKRM